MNERQIANLIGMLLRQRDFTWSRISASDSNTPCTIHIRTKDDENGSGGTYGITVMREDDEEEAGPEPKTKGKIWELKSPMNTHSGFPQEVTVRSKFRDNGYAYIVYAALGSQTMCVVNAGTFNNRYRLKPEYVTGGLYWSPSNEAFYLYPGEGQAIHTFRQRTMQRDSAVAGMVSSMPNDAKQVQYPEGTAFTLKSLK